MTSPLSHSLKSSITDDDYFSSDFSRADSEAGLIYAYSSKTILRKAESLQKSEGSSAATFALMRSKTPCNEIKAKCPNARS